MLMGQLPENIIPMVVESGARGERSFDIYSMLPVSYTHLTLPTTPYV